MAPFWKSKRFLIMFAAGTILALGVFLLLALVSYHEDQYANPDRYADLPNLLYSTSLMLFTSFGGSAYFLVALAMAWSVIVFFRERDGEMLIRAGGTAVLLCAASALFALWGTDYLGGGLGGGIAGVLRAFPGTIVGSILMSFLFVASFIVATDWLFYSALREAIAGPDLMRDEPPPVPLPAVFEEAQAEVESPSPEDSATGVAFEEATATGAALGAFEESSATGVAVLEEPAAPEAPAEEAATDAPTDDEDADEAEDRIVVEEESSEAGESAATEAAVPPALRAALGAGRTEIETEPTDVELAEPAAPSLDVTVPAPSAADTSGVVPPIPTVEMTEDDRTVAVGHRGHSIAVEPTDVEFAEDDGPELVPASPFSFFPHVPEIPSSEVAIEPPAPETPADEAASTESVEFEDEIIAGPEAPTPEATAAIEVEETSARADESRAPEAAAAEEIDVLLRLVEEEPPFENVVLDDEVIQMGSPAVEEFAPTPEAPADDSAVEVDDEVEAPGPEATVAEIDEPTTPEATVATAAEVDEETPAPEASADEPPVAEDADPKFESVLDMILGGPAPAAAVEMETESETAVAVEESPEPDATDETSVEEADEVEVVEETVEEEPEVEVVEEAVVEPDLDLPAPEAPADETSIEEAHTDTETKAEPDEAPSKVTGDTDGEPPVDASPEGEEASPAADSSEEPPSPKAEAGTPSPEAPAARRSGIMGFLRRKQPEGDPTPRRRRRRVTETPSLFEDLPADKPSDLDAALVDQAARLAIERGRASVVLFQRRLSVGYTRARALVERLADEGVLGEMGETGSHPVLLSEEAWNDRGSSVA